MCVANLFTFYKNIHIHPGRFPTGATPIENEVFSFVHIDVDTYEGTLDCLKYFYSKMNVGGIMLTHDYFVLQGVRRAFSEFFQDKPELIIELPHNQSLIVKL